MRPKVDEATYRIETKVERTLWWFQVRRRIVARLLAGLDPPVPSRALILDVGCGTGANGPVLAGEGDRVLVGADRSTLALRLLGEGGGPHGPRIAADATALPFGGGRFDLVAALDVLEHLDDDLAGARELARVVRPGGSVVVTVPAHRLLWGIQDEVSHHRRRYERAELLDLLERAGLAIERCTAFNMLLLPPILVARLLLRGVRPSWLRSENEIGGPIANAALRAIFALEVPLLDRLDLPVGVSLAAVARSR